MNIELPGKCAPQRTCLACRQVKAKRQLVRIVRTPENQVELDPGGKKSGRGAYLCRARSCWDAGLKAGRIERALRTTITPENRARLIKSAYDLIEGNSDKTD